MFITMDPYYDINFYNECLHALENNDVNFKEYISTKPPYEYYIEIDNKPMFINYDAVNDSYSKWLVNIVKALKPNDDYIYLRRDSIVNLKAINHYAINDALRTGVKTGEGIFFTSTKEDILKISKNFPRKIYYFGRYFNNKYRVFFSDSLLIQNFLNQDQILVSSKSFKSITELEVDLNYNVFHEKDRLEKLSETPYVLNGKYHQINTTKKEIMNRLILS